ncbi:MAG: presenilin family intramembrane aspartyl protease PSH [Candidatus Thermoplasmatota archaeon]
MRDEARSVVAMAVLLVGSQLVALSIAPAFAYNQFQAFQNPNDVSNTLLYIVAILVFTAVILGLVKYRHKDIARYVILASVFITVAFVLILPFYYFLAWLPGIVFDANTAGNLATLLAFAGAALVTWVLVKYPEWYVVDTVGLVTAAGVTAILGISFGILPALLLLIALAFYDAWAVYRTKHMVTLADEITSQRLPVLLVIPKHADYKFSEQKSLKEQVAKGEEREAMFIGLGDLIIPGVLSVSALTFLSGPGLSLGGLEANALVALGTILGTLVGFSVLMRYVLKGDPQAGLPLLNGGAIAGFFLVHALVYGSLIPPFF